MSFALNLLNWWLRNLLRVFNSLGECIDMRSEGKRLIHKPDWVQNATEIGPIDRPISTEIRAFRPTKMFVLSNYICIQNHARLSISGISTLFVTHMLFARNVREDLLLICFNYIVRESHVFHVSIFSVFRSCFTSWVTRLAWRSTCLKNQSKPWLICWGLFLNFLFFILTVVSIKTFFSSLCIVNEILERKRSVKPEWFSNIADKVYWDSRLADLVRVVSLLNEDWKTSVWKKEYCTERRISLLIDDE